MQPELIKQKAYAAMPVTFSGKHFCDTLRRLGYDNTWIKQGMHLTFLRRHCTKNGTAGWIKKESVKPEPKPYPVYGIHYPENIAYAINLLKENGYKVYRQEWIEV